MSNKKPPSVVAVKSDNEFKHPLEDVFQALDSYDSEGSTCTGGIATDLPAMPGLVVQGVGEILLPLNQETATKLKAAARQAPHGRGMETIIDKSVRDTLQVDADKVTLTNPAWSAGIKGLTRKVCTALGVNPDLVRSELYKLLLYEEGGFFKKHRDTEKADGMFATLVVQLPSRFTGGSFVVTHNGNTRTFSMQDPKTSPYCCHYVAHYADCEHEILPIESGHRVALLYSLCYTGNKVSRPSVANIKEGPLESAMQRLDAETDEALFAIPMDHQYTTASLARLGVGALKGKDRSLAQTIGRVEGWELLVAKAEKTAHEELLYNPFTGFDVDEISDSVEFRFEELFYRDGKDAKAHGTWLTSHLDLFSFKLGGMMMADMTVSRAMWGSGHSSSVEYTGNEGATRETTYNTYILVAFSKDGVFDNVCHSDFPHAIRMVRGNPSLLNRALEYMKRSKPSISSKDFVTLYTLIQETSSFGPSFHMILGGLAPRPDHLIPPVSSILASVITKHGWDNEKIAPVRLFLKGVADTAINAENCKTLLQVVDKLLSIQEVLKDKAPMESLISGTIHAFDTSTCPLSYYESNDKGRKEIYNHIETLSKVHGWQSSVASVAKVCFARIRNTKPDDPPDRTKIWKRQIAVIQSISTNVPGADTDQLCESVLDEFVAALKGTTVWKSPHFRVLCKALYRYGTPTLFQKVQHWASSTTASLSKLERVDSEFQSLRNSTNTIRSRHPVARDECIAMIHKRVCAMKGDVQQQTPPQENKDPVRTTTRPLTAGKQDTPSGSWSIPTAPTGHAGIDGFLGSEESGPREICVGGGIVNARKLARRWGGLSISSSSANEKLHVRIRETSKTGTKASVIVTKTRMITTSKPLVQQQQQQGPGTARNVIVIEE